MENKTEKEKLFSKCVSDWSKITWAGWWHIDVCYFDEHEYYKQEGLSDGSLAVCSTDWRYMHATIRVNSDKLQEIENEDIEEIAVHEMMHIFLNEMREEGIDHEERVATFLARSFICTRDKTKNDHNL
jgi:hypothetical protein